MLAVFFTALYDADIYILYITTYKTTHFLVTTFESCFMKRRFYDDEDVPICITL